LLLQVHTPPYKVELAGQLPEKQTKGRGFKTGRVVIYTPAGAVVKAELLAFPNVAFKAYEGLTKFEEPH